MSLFSFESVSRMAGYSGNIQADMIDKDRDTGDKVEDRYLCTECACIVPERLWVSKNNCCIECFNDKENKNGIKS